MHEQWCGKLLTYSASAYRKKIHQVNMQVAQKIRLRKIRLEVQ